MTNKDLLGSELSMKSLSLTNRSPNYQYHANCKSFVHYFEDGTLNFYGDIKNNCDNEVYAWKMILEKGSLKIVKELGIAIRRLYVLHDDILRSDGAHEKYEDSVFYGIKRYGNKGYHLLIIAAYHGNFELFKMLRIKIHPTTMITPGQVSFTLLQHMDILKCVN